MREKAKRYPVDRTKLHHALWRRGMTMSSVTRENFYSTGWLHGQVTKGYLNSAAIEILQKYGITAEEVRP